MVKINTNLSSLIVQENLKKSSNKLNTAIERMATGYKINHASDNAANYSIVSDMDTKISSLEVASDNVAMGIDMIQTATESLELVNSHLTRIRDLMEQSANGTYGEESRRAVQSEIDARLEEINRVVANCEYNGIQIFKSGLLPSSSQVKLSEFGMSAGSIDFDVNSSTYTVNLTEEDTLFSLMTKLETIGIKSDFDDNTGIFNINLNSNAITDNGTGFKEILGIADTDGYRTDELQEDVEQKATEIAQLETRLDTIGVTNGNFTIVDEDGFEENNSISVTSTIQDLFDKLAEYNITGSLDENGVITLNTDGYYLKGALANQLGIRYNESSHNEHEGLSVDSVTLVKTVVSTATSSTTMGELGITAGDTLVIRNNNSELIQTIAADDPIISQSVGTFLNNLVTEGYLTSASISDGVISLSSDIHNYVTGTIADKLGIGVITDGSYIINAVTQTSSNTVTYTVTVPAGTDTTFAELSINTDSATEVFDSEGTKLGEFYMTQSSTLEDFIGSINTLNTSANAAFVGGSVFIENGYVSGSIADTLGFEQKTDYSALFSNQVNQVTNFTGDTYIRNGITYTVVGTAADLRTALSSNQNVILSDNIDLDGISWTRIHSYSKILDGNGHVVSNMNINAEEIQSVGLIGYLSAGGTIKNLGIVSSTINSTYTSSNGRIGLITGIAVEGSTISNSFTLDSYIGGSANYVGAITGYISGTITDVNVYNTTVSAGKNGSKDGTGGIAGISAGNGSITNANVFNSNIYASECRNLGGIVGLSDTNLTNVCVYNSTVRTDKTSAMVGGITGYNTVTKQVTEATVYNSYIMGGEHIGGITGFSKSNISNSKVYNSTIRATDTVGIPKAGAISGVSNGQISNCEATAYLYLDSNNPNRSGRLVGLVSIAAGTTAIINTRYSVTSNRTISNVIGTVQGTGTQTSNVYINYSINARASITSAATFGTSVTNGGERSYYAKANDINNITSTETLTNSTTLGQLGFNSSKTFTMNGGNVITIGIGDNIVSKLTGAGLTANVSNGQLTVSGDSSHYLTSMDSALASALKINVGENYTYTITGDVTHSNTNSAPQNITTRTTLSSSNSSSISMADLGLSSNGTITTNNYVITVNKTDMMSDVITKLGNAGITASINDSNGTLTLSGSANDYITSAANNIKNLLGIQTGNGYTYDSYSVTTRANSASKAECYTRIYTIQQTATENTRLGKLHGECDALAGNLAFTTENGIKTINVTADDTIKSLRNKLSENGITTDFTGGKLTISGNKGSISMNGYGDVTTSKIADLMNLDYSANLDNYAISDNINDLADEKYEENNKIPDMINLFIGINGNADEFISFNTSINMGRVTFDALTSENAIRGLSKIDTIINALNLKQTEFASVNNRLDSASESIMTYIDNLMSSRSTLRDADIAEESSNYIKAQILQQASATLLATANQSPAIALQLI